MVRLVFMCGQCARNDIEWNETVVCIEINNSMHRVDTQRCWQDFARFASSWDVSVCVWSSEFIGCKMMANLRMALNCWSLNSWHCARKLITCLIWLFGHFLRSNHRRTRHHIKIDGCEWDGCEWDGFNFKIRFNISSKIHFKLRSDLIESDKLSPKISAQGNVDIRWKYRRRLIPKKTYCVKLNWFQHLSIHLSTNGMPSEAMQKSLARVIGTVSKLVGLWYALDWSESKDFDWN